MLGMSAQFELRYPVTDWQTWSPISAEISGNIVIKPIMKTPDLSRVAGTNSQRLLVDCDGCNGRSIAGSSLTIDARKVA